MLCIPYCLLETVSLGHREETVRAYGTFGSRSHSYIPEAFPCATMAARLSDSRSVSTASAVSRVIQELYELVFDEAMRAL